MLGHVLNKDVNVGFYFHLCHVLIHTYTRIEVKTTITALCGIVWMEKSTVYIHLWLSLKDQWDVSLSILTILQFQKFSISTQTFKLRIRRRCSMALYTSTQDKDNEKQLRIGCAVIKRMKHLIEEIQMNEYNRITTEPSFSEGLCRVYQD